MGLLNLCRGWGRLLTLFLNMSLVGQCISYFSHTLDGVSDRSNSERIKPVPRSEYIVHGGGEGIVVDEDLCQGIRRTKRWHI